MSWGHALQANAAIFSKATLLDDTTMLVQVDLRRIQMRWQHTMELHDEDEAERMESKVEHLLFAPSFGEWCDSDDQRQNL